MDKNDTIYIDGDPDWNKPRAALAISILLAAIFTVRGLAVLDSYWQFVIYGILIAAVLIFGIAVYHKYSHSRVKIGEKGIEVAVSIFRRKFFERDKINRVDQLDNFLVLELKNGNRVKVPLSFFTPEALGRVRKALNLNRYDQD